MGVFAIDLCLFFFLMTNRKIRGNFESIRMISSKMIGSFLERGRQKPVSFFVLLPRSFDIIKRNKGLNGKWPYSMRRRA